MANVPFNEPLFLHNDTKDYYILRCDFCKEGSFKLSGADTDKSFRDHLLIHASVPSKIRHWPLEELFENIGIKIIDADDEWASHHMSNHRAYQRLKRATETGEEGASSVDEEGPNEEEDDAEEDDPNDSDFRPSEDEDPAISKASRGKDHTPKQDNNPDSRTGRGDNPSTESSKPSHNLQSSTASHSSVLDNISQSASASPVEAQLFLHEARSVSSLTNHRGQRIIK